MQIKITYDKPWRDYTLRNLVNVDDVTYVIDNIHSRERDYSLFFNLPNMAERVRSNQNQYRAIARIPGTGGADTGACDAETGAYSEVGDSKIRLTAFSQDNISLQDSCRRVIYSTRDEGEPPLVTSGITFSSSGTGLPYDEDYFSFLTVIETRPYSSANPSHTNHAFPSSYETAGNCDNVAICVKRENLEKKTLQYVFVNTLSDSRIMEAIVEKKYGKHGVFSTDADYGVLKYNIKERDIETVYLFNVTEVAYQGVPLQLPGNQIDELVIYKTDVNQITMSWNNKAVIQEADEFLPVPSLQNSKVDFYSIPSTYTTTTETKGCPYGFAGKFKFDAIIRNTKNYVLSDITVGVRTLTKNNLLLVENDLLAAEKEFTITKGDDYLDGQLRPGESVSVPFTVCLAATNEKFMLFVDVIGNERPNDTRPAFIQSNLGLQKQNYELVIQEGLTLRHYWRNNDDLSFPWVKGSKFGGEVSSAPGLIQNRINDNLEIVYRDTNNRLRHWWRSENDRVWHEGNNGQSFAANVMSTPALIQSNLGENGNFEVVFRDEKGKLRHWWRNNDNDYRPWTSNGESFGENVTSAPALIQNRINNNLEVIYRDTNNRLRHWWRDEEDRVWREGNGGEPFASGVISDPAFTQSNLGGRGNFEVVVHQGDKLRHWFRNNDDPNRPWSEGNNELPFADGITSGPALIQSKLGRFEETPILPSSTEISLVGPGGILDQLYGLDNLTRISDSEAEYWISFGEGQVKVRAAFTNVSVDNPLTLGVIDDSNLFRVFLAVQGMGFAPNTASGSFPGFSTFQWGIGRPTGPNPDNEEWSSQASSNRDGADHMVAWKITGGEERGNPIGYYVIAWEDYVDQDFNDLVVEVNNVVPSRRGNFEVIVREGDALHHWWRNNDDPSFPWKEGNAGQPIP